MRIRLFLTYWAQTLVAELCAPVMRVTGLRFGKSWRGNWIVHHVHANAVAEGFRPGFLKFFNAYF